MRCLRNSKRSPFRAEAHAGIMRHLNRSPIHREGACWPNEASLPPPQSPRRPPTSIQREGAAGTMRHLCRPPIQRESILWHCAARREIAERSEEAPEAEAAQPSENAGIWKALTGHAVGVGIYDKPSGVVRGECRGGLGGAAAPNRPPSAARREGGQNSAKREAATQGGPNKMK